MQCHVFHMIRSPRRQDREAPLNLPVSTVNIDALARHGLLGLKQELEYEL